MYSKSQKKFLEFILNYKRNEINISFSEVFYEYILNFYKNFIIEFDNDNINFYKIKSNKKKINPDETKEFQEEVVSILYLVYELYIQKHLIFYGDKKTIKNIYIDLINEDNFLFEIQLDFFKNINNNIFKNYIISSELKELGERKFDSIEQKNLNFTKWALITSIGATIFSILTTIFGFYWQWHIATKISTVVEFANFEDLKYIAELIKNLSK